MQVQLDWAQADVFPEVVGLGPLSLHGKAPGAPHPRHYYTLFGSNLTDTKWDLIMASTCIVLITLDFSLFSYADRLFPFVLF